MKEKTTKKTVMEKLIVEMAKPHISASGKAGLAALVKSQKVLPKATK
jgi:hypothetical protein